MEDGSTPTYTTKTSPTQSTSPFAKMQNFGKIPLGEWINLGAGGRMFTPAEETIPDSTPKRGQSKVSLLTMIIYFYTKSMPAVFDTLRMRCLHFAISLPFTNVS